MYQINPPMKRREAVMDCSQERSIAKSQCTSIKANNKQTKMR